MPGVVAGYLPWAFFGLDRTPFDPRDPLTLLGVVCMTAGAALLGACIWEFARSGKGTLSPIDPPRQLVVRGLYRYVRNPMYLAVSTIVIGEALWARSWPLLGYWACFFTAANLFVIGYEEPWLRSRFGASYDAYARAVGRWVPTVPGR
jgi:protein-S-isoprenylcysteine O-methyltransferase Ste14